jgi:hypothetical protein
MKLETFTALAIVVLAPMISWAQHHADLAPAEIDELRDAAMDPDIRLKLYLKFARARMASIEQVRTDPKIAPADRPQETHARLEEFQDLYDELNDNIDTYVDRKDDVRKPLKAVIEADVEFQNKLKAFADASTAAKEDTKPYEFLLTSVIDTVNSSAEDHRRLLDEQEEAAKHKKNQQRRSRANEQQPVIR